ncbi:MAG: alcohol dehydrogenase, partial [Thermofilaceae archaeon]
FSIYKKELKIMGAHLNPLTMKEAVRIVESGDIAFEKLVTERLALDEVKMYLEDRRRTLLKGIFLSL